MINAKYKSQKSIDSVSTKALSPEGKNKRRQFKQKFNIDKEKLNEKDIIQIMNSLQLETNNHIEIEEQSKKLVNKLDNDNDGLVQTNDLIEEMVTRNAETIEDEFTVFYKKINEYLHTKSEDIILKLKNLLNKKWVVNQKKLIEKIESIITIISEENLYEIESDLKNIGKEGRGFLAKYSQVEDSERKEKDLILVKKSLKKYSIDKTIPNFNSSNRRRSTDLSLLVSPSIIARMYEQMSKIDKCDFNIFELDEILGKKTSIFMAEEILGRFPFIDNNIISIDTFKNFITQIVTHYDRIKALYHNDLHAGDVMQTCFTIFTQGKLKEKMKLNDLDIFSMLVGALCHDYKHPGTNNLYQINTRSKYAMRYNDTSVLEMYHLAQTFKELQHDKYNIFKNFSPEEYRICRRRMIDGILATDMANHQKVLSAAKAKAETFNIKKGKNFEKIFEENDEKMVKLYDSQQCILNMIIHTADISNPGKPDKISAAWTKRVYDEFFVQGDYEKKLGLEISNFCDRNTTNVNKAMVGFISFVVGPTIDTLTNLIPEVFDYTEYCRSNLRKHKIGAKNDDYRASRQKKKKNKNEKK